MVVKDIAADKEVILAAGTINSPKLLMLSGVGDAKALRSFGINVVENLPGVGENLQDHVLVSGVVFKYKGKMPDRPADSNAVEAEAYLSSSLSGDADISLVLHQLPVVTPEVAERFGTPPPDTARARRRRKVKDHVHQPRHSTGELPTQKIEKPASCGTFKIVKLPAIKVVYGLTAVPGSRQSAINDQIDKSRTAQRTRDYPKE